MNDELTPFTTPPDLLSAMTNIVNFGKEDVARLPEPLFISHLLPRLTDSSGNADLTIWSDIAGNGFRPIDVFNPATGEVLFRVPALYVEQRFPYNTARTSIVRLVEEANRRSSQHPAIGQAFLKQQLATRPVPQYINVEHIQAWNAILKRYGLPPVTTAFDEVTQEMSSGSAAAILDDEQEDF